MWFAIETMLSFESGMIGFPLRLLAREVYDKCTKKVGSKKVALITGEEKIIPKVKRSNVLFFAQRAIQELSYDTFKSEK